MDPSIKLEQWFNIYISKYSHFEKQFEMLRHTKTLLHVILNYGQYSRYLKHVYFYNLSNNVWQFVSKRDQFFF